MYNWILVLSGIADNALNRWYADLSVSSLSTLYRHFKQQLCFEKYQREDLINKIKMYK